MPENKKEMGTDGRHVRQILSIKEELRNIKALKIPSYKKKF